MINTSSGEGGGVYASGTSSVILSDNAEIYNNTAGGSGGGAYLDASSLVMYAGGIRYNSATNFGGGLAAFNSSTVTVGISNSYCTTTPCLRLENNTSSVYGGGLYLNSGSASINYARVMNNAGTLGGGVYVLGASFNAHGTLFARNNATSTAGDGLRLISASTFNGVNVTFANNNAAGAATGRAIDLSGSTVNLSCSVVWNHSVQPEQCGSKRGLFRCAGRLHWRGQSEHQPAVCQYRWIGFPFAVWQPGARPLPVRIDL